MNHGLPNNPVPIPKKPEEIKSLQKDSISNMKNNQELRKRFFQFIFELFWMPLGAAFLFLVGIYLQSVFIIYAAISVCLIFIICGWSIPIISYIKDRNIILYKKLTREIQNK